MAKLNWMSWRLKAFWNQAMVKYDEDYDDYVESGDNAGVCVAGERGDELQSVDPSANIDGEATVFQCF